MTSSNSSAPTPAPAAAADVAGGTGHPPARTRRGGVALTAALAGMLALAGCGIRSTAVPVDAGVPASRTACPPTGRPSTGFSAPAAVPPSDLLPGMPSATPWELIASPSGGVLGDGSVGSVASATTPMPGKAPARAGTGAAASTGAASTGTGPATKRSPEASVTGAPATGAATDTPAATSGQGLESCPGVTRTAGAATP